jgi:hypothetical protein
LKIFVFILSIYLLVLPGLTCAETGMCTDDVQSSVTQADNHPENEPEDCGSFCTCSCCMHIVSANFQSLKTAAEKPLAKNKLPFFYNNISLPSNYFGNIWQPPKIG